MLPNFEVGLKVRRMKKDKLSAVLMLLLILAGSNNLLAQARFTIGADGEITTVNDDAAWVLKAHSGINFEDGLAVGLGFGILLNEPNTFEFAGAPADETYDLRMGWAGPYISYDFDIRNKLSGRLKSGYAWGQADLVQSDELSEHRAGISVTSIESSLLLEVFPTGVILLTGGYRYVSDPDENWLGQIRLSGPYLSVGLELGPRP
jgi:hypothetical protein